MNVIIPLLLLTAHSVYSGALPQISSKLPSKAYFDEIVERVNSAGAKWMAGHNFEGSYDAISIDHLLGSIDAEVADDNDLALHTATCSHGRLGQDKVGHDNHAKEFDGGEEWKYCPSVTEVKNQGKCGSDWALTPVAAISDRICINTKGKNKVNLSSHEPLSCCKTCGWGCEKGYPQMAYKYYINKGLRTGGNYNSKQGCQPYEIKPCKDYKDCLVGTAAVKTPSCKTYCYNKNYKKKYDEDVYKGYSFRRMTCPFCASDELKRGPLTATMTVYEDFLTYKSGIYHHVTGKKLGKLTVKLIGFNDTDKDNKYWIAVNSWGTKWGDKGLFKISRGNNECMVDITLQAAWVEKVE